MSNDNIVGKVILAVFILALISLVGIFEGNIIGFVILGEPNYNDKIDVSFTSNSSYIWILNEEGSLVNKEGKLVDEDFKLINDAGEWIDEDGKVVDVNGNKVDEDGDVIHANYEAFDNDLE